MRNQLTSLLCAATLLFVSCKKDVTARPSGASQFGLETATVMASGKLQFSDEKTTGGVVKIYQRKDGSLVLGIEQLTYKSPSPTAVYLSAAAVVTAGATNLYSATDFCGDLYIVLAPGLNPSALKWVILEQTGMPATATARLQ